MVIFSLEMAGLVLPVAVVDDLNLPKPFRAALSAAEEEAPEKVPDLGPKAPDKDEEEDDEEEEEDDRVDEGEVEADDEAEEDPKGAGSGGEEAPSCLSCIRPPELVTVGSETWLMAWSQEERSCGDWAEKRRVMFGPPSGLAALTSKQKGLAAFGGCFTERISLEMVREITSGFWVRGNGERNEGKQREMKGSGEGNGEGSEEEQEDKKEGKKNER